MSDANKKKAANYYLSGALYDFQDQYERALLEYFQALVYDSTSAQILKAIGRNFLRTRRFESAIEYLKKSLHHNPNDKETVYYLAEAYFNNRDLVASARYFEKYMQIDPYNKAVQNNLAYLYTQLGETEKLIQLRERQLELSGFSEEAVIQLYRLYLKLERYEQAELLAKRFIEKRPQLPDGWLLLGNLYELKKDTAAAIQSYQHALRLNTDNKQAILQLYRIHRSNGDWQGMVQTFGQIFRIDSTNVQVRLILSEGYLFLKQYDHAKRILRPLIRDQQNREQALEMLGRIASDEKNFEEAETYFKELTQINPKNKFGWFYLALLYNQQRHFQESLRVLQTALENLHNDADLLGLYGSTLSQLNRDREALDILERANRLDPKNLNTIVSLGIIYDRLKMFQKSDSLYEAALKIYPDYPLLLNNYSYSLCEREIQLERALKMAMRALEQEPENGAFLDTVGWIYYKMGDYQTALKYIQKAIELREDSPVVIEHLGDIYYKLGNTEEARKYWQKAFEKDPSNQQLKEKLQSL